MDMDYEQLPQRIKDNVPEDRWPEVRRRIIPEGAPTPDASQYINVKNGLIRTYGAHEPADAPLLAAHDLGIAHHTQP